MNTKGGEIKDWFYGMIFLLIILFFFYFFLPTLITLAKAFAGSAGG